MTSETTGNAAHAAKQARESAERAERAAKRAEDAADAELDPLGNSHGLHVRVRSDPGAAADEMTAPRAGGVSIRASAEQ